MSHEREKSHKYKIIICSLKQGLPRIHTVRLSISSHSGKSRLQWKPQQRASLHTHSQGYRQGCPGLRGPGQQWSWGDTNVEEDLGPWGGGTGVFTAPHGSLQGKKVQTRLHRVREQCTQEMCAEPKRAKWDAGNERKGRWRAATAKRTPGRSCDFACGEPQALAEQRPWRKWGRDNLHLVPREAQGAGGHVADTLSSGRGHVHVGHSQEQTQTVAGPPACRPPPSLT